VSRFAQNVGGLILTATLILIVIFRGQNLQMSFTANVLNHQQEPRSNELGTKYKFKESNELGQPENGAGSCRVHLLVIFYV